MVWFQDETASNDADSGMDDKEMDNGSGGQTDRLLAALEKLDIISHYL